MPAPARLAGRDFAAAGGVVQPAAQGLPFAGPAAHSIRRLAIAPERGMPPPMAPAITSRFVAGPRGVTIGPRPRPTRAPIQRVDAPGTPAPADVCKAYIEAAKLGGGQKWWKILETPVKHSEKWHQACAAFLRQFDSTALGHARAAAGDFAPQGLTAPDTVSALSWIQVRRQVAEWRDRAEADYKAYSEISAKEMPSAEEYEMNLRQAWASASGAFPF